MSQRICKNKARVALCFFFLFLALQIVLVLASSNSDFDQILQPLQTVYDLVKYATTIIAGLVLLFAGLTYITSGSDPGKREKAKNMVMYVIIGLAIIWAAPFIVRLILNQ
jgi:hypothetical protein